MEDVANIWIWTGFSLFLLFALCIDAMLLKKKFARPSDSWRASICWTLVWVSSALLFNLLLWIYLRYTTNPIIAQEVALNFLTGYLIEKSLSIDNLFAFYMVFTQLNIPDAYQQRVFSYGIWSAIVMRLIMILLGTWLVVHFHWLLYLMGAFLLLTGIKMFFIREHIKDIADVAIIKMTKRFFRVTDKLHENRFFIRQHNLLYATPLFIALVFIEFSDLIFAFDSIPAIFAITQDPFIVWSSNIFAILGLRALYFVLANMVMKLHLLKYGIALILVFVGTKMVIAPWMKIPVLYSLGIIAIILALFTLLSLLEKPDRGK